MKYLFIFVLLISANSSYATEYTVGCGTKVESQNGDLYKKHAQKATIPVLGVRCQFLVTTTPQSGKWLLSLPNVTVETLNNSFFNSYDEKSSALSINTHWPLYRGKFYEAGVNLDYNQKSIAFELDNLNLIRWPNGGLVDQKQTYDKNYVSLAAYIFFPESKIVNEAGLGINRYSTTSLVHNPDSRNDYLTSLNMNELFLYIAHRAQNIGWDMPFSFALSQGQTWHDTVNTKPLNNDLAGIDINIGVSYAYRASYSWTFRIAANQKTNLRFSPIRDNSHYLKSRIAFQRAIEFSVYRHF